jgi:hypothetical protein
LLIAMAAWVKIYGSLGFVYPHASRLRMACMGDAPGAAALLRLPEVPTTSLPKECINPKAIFILG